MKWVLVVWYMLGPVDAPLEGMEIRYMTFEYKTASQCFATLNETQKKIESLPDFRGAALECRMYDAGS